MKVSLTMEFDERLRRAINKRKGAPGLASRDRCQKEMQMIVEATFRDYLDELEKEENPC